MSFVQTETFYLIKENLNKILNISVFFTLFQVIENIIVVNLKA